jgi:hypothetical protein
MRELRWVQQVVREVDRQERCGYPPEHGCRIVVEPTVELEEDVAGVRGPQFLVNDARK